jgi:hypothetical protein
MLLMRAIVAYAENFFHQVRKFWMCPSKVGILPPLLNASSFILAAFSSKSFSYTLLFTYFWPLNETDIHSERKLDDNSDLQLLGNHSVIL